jgi:hypothetical protein
VDQVAVTDVTLLTATKPQQVLQTEALVVAVDLMAQALMARTVVQES